MKFLLKNTGPGVRLVPNVRRDMVVIPGRSELIVDMRPGDAMFARRAQAVEGEKLMIEALEGDVDGQAVLDGADDPESVLDVYGEEGGALLAGSANTTASATGSDSAGGADGNAVGGADGGAAGAGTDTGTADAGDSTDGPAPDALAAVKDLLARAGKLSASDLYVEATRAAPPAVRDQLPQTRDKLIKFLTALVEGK